jgi:Exostosin family
MDNMIAFTPKRKLFITGIREQPSPSVVAGGELQKRYGLSRFENARTIEEADIVLYLENGYVGLADLPGLLRRVRSARSAMHFIFSESDWPFPVLPGAYTSLSKPCAWGHSWSFLPSFRLAAREESVSKDAEPEFLFSFLGRVATHPVRRKIRSLDSASTPCLDAADGPKRFPCFDYSKTYAQLLGRSRFILCPRGFGASSIRMFEAMSFGRVPVIISDAWQPPPGIPWREFSVVIPESDVSGIPVVLERLESKAQPMGQLARQVFDAHFAPGIFFDRLLVTLISKYANLSFTPAAICWRAWRAAGWREIQTLCHQARSRAVACLSARR